MAQTVKNLLAMPETWVQSLGWEDLLEKEMATHSSILAWKIPWTAKPGRLQSMGSQRVGHDLGTSLHFTRFVITFTAAVTVQSDFGAQENKICDNLRILFWTSLMAQGSPDGKSLCQQCRRPYLDPWVGKIPWRRKRQPTPVFLPGKSHGQKSLVGYSPWGCKELDTTERLSFFSLLPWWLRW